MDNYLGTLAYTDGCIVSIELQYSTWHLELHVHLTITQSNGSHPKYYIVHLYISKAIKLNGSNLFCFANFLFYQAPHCLLVWAHVCIIYMCM